MNFDGEMWKYAVASSGTDVRTFVVKLVCIIIIVFVVLQLLELFVCILSYMIVIA